VRSFRELSFRLRQEAANGLLYFSPPNLKLPATAPLDFLPQPSAVGEALRDSDYSRELARLADEIVQGRIPVLGDVVDYGPVVAWRRDPQRGIETRQKYFRTIPYLDLVSAGDHKLIWEVNRHQHLVLLSQAFVITGQDKYFDTVVRQLDHWWAENQFQRGINWTSALEVAFRALSWIWIWHLMGERMSDSFRRRFLAELHRHGLHLEYNLSIYFSPNTHLLGEAVALHALGRLFPGFPRAGRWRKLGREIVRQHMNSCVKSDGSYFEQSTYYHVYAMDMFAFHTVLEGISEPYLDGLERMAEFLAAITSDSGDLPFLGDDDGGRFFSPYGPRGRFARATLATVSLLLGKRFFPYSRSDIEEVALWWLKPERCKSSESDALEIHSRRFEWSGIVAMRHGPVHALFDAGPFGPWGGGHSHSDTLSLVVTSGDHEVLIDSGTYSYMDQEWRDLFRGSSAHNTIRIDSCDQGLPDGPFRWAQKPETSLLEFASDAELDRAVAVCRYHGFSHTRTVEFVNSSQFDIVDHVDGPSGEHVVEQFWHFAASPSELSAGIWRIGDIAEFSAEGGVLEEASRSRCFGSRETASVIVVRRRATMPIRLYAILRLKLQPE
jgi:Heparinase II/III-like protein/Heparinase II/III N-terminus